MHKHFNTTGLCYPEEHYMVNIEKRLDEIKILVDGGAYFSINRARQYGKTTTIHLLTEKLSEDYALFSISFEGIEDEVYSSSASFCERFCRLLYRYLLYHKASWIPEAIKDEIRQTRFEKMDMEDLSELISELCVQSKKHVVLIIDEVDQAGNQQLFLTFLGMLRRKYLARKAEPTFQSVILAGVYDIKNLKLKIRREGSHQYNSLWNIASDFMVDMSFSAADIAGMLKEYEKDVHTGMDTCEIGRLIYEYTSGYPFFVSRICKIMDEYVLGNDGFEDLSSVWTGQGVVEAVKILLAESNTLFDDMVKRLNDFPELRQALYRILFCGEPMPYNVHNHVVNLGVMFGFIEKNPKSEAIVISNRIFETQLYNLFFSEELIDSNMYKAASIDKEGKRFVRDGKLDMEQVLERFVVAFTDIYADADEAFVEENGRRFFLLYLKPIINGVGNFYVEARTRNMRRTDVVVDYKGQQFVCELKIWHGEEYNRRGEEQLAGYLDAYHLTTGYMLSFNFNKKKKTGVQRIRLGDKLLVEAVV